MQITNSEWIITSIIMFLNRKFGILLIANSINILAQWSVLSLLTKYQKYAELGKFSLALAVIAPILTISSAQIKTLVASDVKDTHSISSYFSTRILLWLLSLFFLILLSSWWYETYINIFVLYLNAKSIESLSDICYGFNLKNGEEKRIAVSIFLRGILGWLGLCFITIYFDSIRLGLIYMTTINIVILIAFDLNYLRLSISRKILLNFFSAENKKILLILTPFGLIATLSSLSTSIPRLFIDRMLDLKQLAIYTNLSYIWIAGSYLAYTLGDSLITKLSTYIRDNDKRNLYLIMKFLFKLSALIFIISICLSYFWGKQLLSIIYTKDIQSYNNTFVTIISILPLSLLYPFITNYFIITNNSIFQFCVHVLSLLVIIIICYLLIPKIGILGAAVAQLAGYLGLILLSIIKILKEQKNHIKPIKKYATNS